MSVQIDVAKLFKEPVGFQQNARWEGSVIELDDRGTAAADGELTLTRTDRGVWALGEIAIELRLTCSRCLTEFARIFPVQMDEVFLPADTAEENPTHLGDSKPNEDWQSIDEQHILDLTEVFRQYHLSVVPLAPLCQERCKGICPECGIDLNGESCACQRYVDPRWDKLRELLR